MVWKLLPKKQIALVFFGKEKNKNMEKKYGKIPKIKKLSSSNKFLTSEFPREEGEAFFWEEAFQILIKTFPPAW